MNNHPLYEARKSRDMTLHDVARVVDSDTGNISRIEKGRQMPGPKLMLKLLGLFTDVTANDILKNHASVKKSGERIAA